MTRSLHETPNEHPENLDLVIPAQGVELHKEGKYVAILNIDGEQSGYLVLNPTSTSYWPY